MMRDQTDSKLNLLDDFVPSVSAADAPSIPRFDSGNYIFKPTDSLQFRIVDDTDARVRRLPHDGLVGRARIRFDRFGCRR
jgi:hypothetical protein